MIKLTRRTLLVGTSALTVAGMVSFRTMAASRTYHALLIACTEYPALPQRNWLIGHVLQEIFVDEAGIVL
ncbi:MAG: hypothetical protein E5Y31_30795, partial [Mesorhizobium sp.]